MFGIQIKLFSVKCDTSAYLVAFGKLRHKSFKNFLKGEVRYASLAKQYPAEAGELFQAAQDNAKWRYNNYKRLAKQQWGVEQED